MEAPAQKGMGGPRLASPPAPLHVLVLDGDHALALPVVRSLGRRRGRVTLAASRRAVAAAASRYCHKTVTSPALAGETGARWLGELTRRDRFDALFCFESRTAALLAALRAPLPCPLPRCDSVAALTEPDAARRLAAALGVATAAGAGPLEGPCHDFALVALVRRGEPVATFVHRLADAPRFDATPWFARPALESADRADVRAAGVALLARSGWHGVATLGFRLERRSDRLVWLGAHPGWSDGLDLAIACGVDLPWLYAQLAAGRPVTGPTRYRVGLRYRRLCTPPAGANPLRRSWRALAALRPGVRTDLLLRDPLPHLPGLGGAAAAWLRRRGAAATAPFSVIPGGRARK